MTRNEFCAVTGVHSERLSSLARRDLLPFALPKGASKWARLEYSPIRAAMLIAFDELTDGGLSAEIASEVLLKRESAIARGPLHATKTQEKGVTRWGYAGAGILFPTDVMSNDIWIGISNPVKRSPVFFFGKLSEIIADLHEGEQALRLDDGQNFSRLFLVNFTQAIRTLNRRAAEQGILLDNQESG